MKKCNHKWVDTVDHPGGEPYWECKKCKEIKPFTLEDYKKAGVKLNR